VTVPRASIERRVWLSAGTLLDGTSTTPARDAHIVYNSREILFVGRDGQLPPRDLIRPGQTTPDVDARSSTLLPGLIDAHAHFFLEGGELDFDARVSYLAQGPAALLAQAEARLERLVRLGIAGVRDAGDKHGVGLALSARARTSGALMPYVDSPGAAINHKGRYGGFMSEPIEDDGTPEAAVRSRVARGADRIKLIPTGIINFQKANATSAPQMTADEVRALVGEARACGRQTFAHASGDAGIDCAIHGGVDSVEHGFFLRDDQLAYMRDHRIAWVPTFAPVQEQIDHADRMGWDETTAGNLGRILEGHAQSLVRAHDMGVIIAAGSDAGSVGVSHGLGLLREMALMEHAGLPPIAVINAATGSSADRFAYREPIGRIAPGARSRFILTAHSPLDTVAHLSRPRTVIFDEEVFNTDGVEEKGL